MTASNRLFVQVFFGQTGTFIRSFGPEDGRLEAQARDDATIPVWGTPSAEAGFTLAEPTATGYRISVPPDATVEGDKSGAPSSARSLELRLGDRVRIQMGKTVILLSLEPAPVAIQKNYRRAVLPVLVLLVTFIFPIYFLIARHTEKDSRRQAAQELWRASHRGLPDLIRPGDEPPAAQADAAQPEQTAKSLP